MAHHYTTWIKVGFNEHDNEQAFIDATRKKVKELIEEVGYNNSGDVQVSIVEIHWADDLDLYDLTCKKPDRIVWGELCKKGD